MFRIFSNKWLPYLLLAAATALVWGQTVKFGFVWDDKYFIEDSSSIRSLKNVPAMFYQLDAQSSFPEGFIIFRPIRTAHYALLYFLANKSSPQPWVFHLANIIWHGATAMMLFSAATLLLRRLRSDFSELESKSWAFFIALAFAVHPVVSEVVCWAKSLDDILAAFFTLAALRELLQPPEKRAAYWRGVLFFVLAIYSKESAVPFVIVPAILFFAIHKLPLKETARRSFPFLFSAVIYLFHRHLVMGRTSQTAPISGSYGQTLIDMFPVVSVYFRLLFGIPPFCIDYSYWHGGEKLFSQAVLTGMALLAILVAAGFIAWRSKQFRLVGFGLAWTGLFLLPVSNLVPMMQYLAERFLYLPLIGWLIALAGILITIRRKALGQFICFCIIVFWGINAWNRSWIWQDAMTLFIRTSKECPKCQRVENNAVVAIFELPQIKRFFRLENDRLKVVSNIDSVSTDKVIQTFELGLNLFPENHDLISALGVTFASTGQPEKALPYFNKAVLLQPQNPDDSLNLARAALAANQLSTANSALEKALAIEPNNRFALAMKFELLRRTNDYVEALKTARHWNQVAPDNNSAAALKQAEEELAKTNHITAPEIPR